MVLRLKLYDVFSLDFAREWTNPIGDLSLEWKVQAQ